MVDHTVRAYDDELMEIGRKIAEMGGIAEKMLSEAIEALISLNVDAAKSIIATDPRLDQLQREIEEEAVHIIARRQPLGADLREIIGAMRISGVLPSPTRRSNITIGLISCGSGRFGAAQETELV